MSDPYPGRPYEIRATSVLADGRVTFLGMTTRWNYLHKWIPIWKEAVKFRLYSYALFALGIYFLFTIPLLAVICLFASMYFYVIMWQKQERFTSDRKVFMGH